MSTRASIAIFRPNGEIEHIYVHWEGQPSAGIGSTLIDHHNSEERASDIVALGDLSFLGRHLVPEEGKSHSAAHPLPGVTIAYHRDRKEPWEETKPQRSASISTWASQRIDDGCEHLYIWRDDHWWYMSAWNQDLKEPLIEVLRRQRDQQHAAKSVGDATPQEDV